MPFFDEKRYKNGSETKVDIMIIFEVFSFQPIGINRVLERDFTSPIIQYIILDKQTLSRILRSLKRFDSDASLRSN